VTAINLSSKRAILTLIALPVAFFAAVMLFSSQPKHSFSQVHKGEIELIAKRICSVAATSACPIEWSGKHKWFGNLPRQGLLSVASVESLSKALPEPEWSVSVSPQEHQFTNGRYIVSYIKQSGSIVISSVE
jgi:hypothetical protein